GKDVQPKKQPGGYDTIPGAEDKTIYTYKGSGFVAFSESEDLLKGVVKPSSTLDKTLDAEMQRRLLGGDVGLYINLAAVQSRYGDQIEQARQSLMGMLDQAGGAGNPGMVEAAKAMYGRVFDAFKYGQALALNFDFDPQGLVVAGQATVKPDSPAAKRLGGGHTGTGAGLARLPADYANYFYLNVSPESFQGLQQMGMATVFGQGGKPSPALQKAIDTQREAGVQEVIAASSMSGGLRYISQTTVKDPQKFVQGMTAMMAAMKSGGEQDFIKDAKVESQAQSHKGFALHKATFTYDLDKLAKMQPNTPGGAQAIKAMLGGDTSTTWYGTDGKVVLAVTAKDWNEAQRQIDALLTGQGSLGEAPGYEAARSKLPQNVTAMILISAQGIVRQMSSALNAMMPGANANPPIDMPKEPALLGASITNTPAGYQFNFAMPSAVGKVIEKGLLPLFQGLQGGKVEK
ncbi:MAG: hypothetical protein IRY99_16985, partial [Isosphaeraceae bacterium]|nr:hypothetical protein [Isosphaeraceae bacterium]